MSSTPALIVSAAGEKLEPGTIERRALRDKDVLIDVAFAGICHSDLHQGAEDWGRAIFPMVPGHEIVGLVAAVGPGVTAYAVGDRVGVGCFANSCGACEYCLRGDEQYCEKGVVPTYNGKDYDGELTYGGYSRQIVTTEHFVVRVPENLDLAAAAPLLCAGITLWSPLEHWKATPATKVAIVGLGGLGHMGVKLAHALGCDVTVLSQSEAKREDAMRLGADHYYATSDPDTFRTLRKTFDLILNTVSVPLPFDRYLSTLRIDGAMVNLGISGQPETFRASSLVGSRRSLTGSNVGGIPATQAMLDFCGEHGIVSEIELIDASRVNEAWERIPRSDVRYRFVIDASTIGADA